MHVMEKIVEELIKMQLNEFIIKNNILADSMHSARKNHSTITAKMELDKFVNTAKDSGKKVAVFSTDLSAAYDTVDHALLLVKLNHMGIRNKAQKFFASYLEDR